LEDLTVAFAVYKRSLEDFLEKLTDTRDKLTWGLVNGQIRGLMSHSGKTIMFCPLTAVAYFNNESYFEMNFVLSAGLRLEMHPEDISRVLRASDIVGEVTDLRLKMEEILQICGTQQPV
jgi:hypothetical protein